MLVDMTNFGLVLYDHANIYRFEETSSYWLVALVKQRHTSGITVYNRTVTGRAVHSCIYWFLIINPKIPNIKTKSEEPEICLEGRHHDNIISSA